MYDILGVTGSAFRMVARVFTVSPEWSTRNSFSLLAPKWPLHLLKNEWDGAAEGTTWFRTSLNTSMRLLEARRTATQR